MAGGVRRVTRGGALFLCLSPAMQKYIEQLDEVRYRINVGAVPNMRVPGRFYVNGALRSEAFSFLVSPLFSFFLLFLMDGGIVSCIPCCLCIVSCSMLSFSCRGCDFSFFSHI